MESKKVKRVTFITSHFGKPRTGGHLYNFFLIELIRQSGIHVNIFAEDTIPNAIKKNLVLLNGWYLFHLIKYKSDILYIDSRMHNRAILFLLVYKICYQSKIIGTVHHLTYTTRKIKFIYYVERFIEKQFIRQYNTVIVPSMFTKQSIDNLVSNKTNIHIIRPWRSEGKIDKKITRKYEKKQKIKLLFVGSVESRKGLIFLVNSVQYLKCTDIVIQVVGSTDAEPRYYKMLQQEISRLNISNKIHFYGYLPNDELDRIYADSDIFVFPTLYEGYGIVITEAMKWGLPIVASNVTSIPEIVSDNVNGILVPPMDSFLLARAIDELACDPQMRMKMGEKSRELWKSLNSKDDFRKQFLKVLLKIEI